VITATYDRVIADVKTKQAGKTQADPKLIDAIVGLLEGMKTAPGSEVTVGFDSRVDPVPVDEETRETEKLVYEDRCKGTPELVTIAKASPDKTAIIGPCDAFGPEQIELLQSVILDLRSSGTSRSGRPALTKRIRTRCCRTPGRNCTTTSRPVTRRGHRTR
jgi:hypothetical protein